VSDVPPLIRKIGKYERLWRERHQRDLELTKLPGGHPKGFRFDEAAGDRVCQFVERYCCHHKGKWAGKPLKLEDWQKEVLRQVFGWLRADGTRRFRTAYIEIARKNGKSTMIGGIGLYLLVADREQGAEVYSSATKKDQAKILWDDAASMVKRSPELKRFVKVYRGSMVCARTNSKFVPLGKDADTLDGLNPHGNLVDELHAHKTRELWDVLDSAMGAREQPLTIAITTAGAYDPEGIGWQQHDYATKVLEGVIEDDAFFAFICTADEGEATEQVLKDNPDYYFSLEAQLKANPNYGVSCGATYLAGQAKKAKDQPGFLHEYLTKHCNIWVRGEAKWLSLEKWAACEPAPPPGANVRELALARRSCFGGLDIAAKLDLNALVLAFPGPNDVIDLVCRFWIPEETVRKAAEKGQRHYEQWVREGWLIATPGPVIDYGFIKSELKLLGGRFTIEQLAFDLWGAQQLSGELLADGFKMVECGQGYASLSEPSKLFQARVAQAKVRHANNPVLRFCVSNAVTRTDPAGNIKPDKSRATDKIDGVVATVMALSRFVATKPAVRDPYASGGTFFQP
jgi:phage terminase large subunit-like protein